MSLLSAQWSALSSAASSSPLLLSVWQLLVNVLIPASLANDASRSLSPQSVRRLSARSSAVQPGDLILVRTPGSVYALFRRVSGHVYDHLAVVMEGGQVLHVGPPTIRLLPVALLLQPSRHPVVYRPQLSAAQRAELIASLQALIGSQYDAVKVFRFIAQLASRQSTQQRRSRAALPPADLASLSSITSPSSSLICTDAILNRLLAVSPAFRQLLQRFAQPAAAASSSSSSSPPLPPLDVLQLRSWSINDVHHLAQIRLTDSADQQPFFQQIALPPPSTGTDSGAEAQRTQPSSLPLLSGLALLRSLSASAAATSPLLAPVVSLLSAGAAASSLSSLPSSLLQLAVSRWLLSRLLPPRVAAFASLLSIALTARSSRIPQSTLAPALLLLLTAALRQTTAATGAAAGSRRSRRRRLSSRL